MNYLFQLFGYSGSNNHTSQVNAFNISHNGVIHVQLLWSYMLQECLPVGCVPSAAVAVCWWGCLPARVWLPRGCLPGGCVYPNMHCRRHPTPLWTEWQTSVKNITFPQLRLRAVINVQVFRIGTLPLANKCLLTDFFQDQNLSVIFKFKCYWMIYIKFILTYKF